DGAQGERQRDEAEEAVGRQQPQRRQDAEQRQEPVAGAGGGGEDDDREGGMHGPYRLADLSLSPCGRGRGLSRKRSLRWQQAQLRCAESPLQSNGKVRGASDGYRPKKGKAVSAPAFRP